MNFCLKGAFLWKTFGSIAGLQPAQEVLQHQHLGKSKTSVPYSSFDVPPSDDQEPTLTPSNYPPSTDKRENSWTFPAHGADFCGTWWTFSKLSHLLGQSAPKSERPPRTPTMTRGLKHGCVFASGQLSLAVHHYGSATKASKATKPNRSRSLAASFMKGCLIFLHTVSQPTHCMKGSSFFINLKKKACTSALLASSS